MENKKAVEILREMATAMQRIRGRRNGKSNTLNQIKAIQMGADFIENTFYIQPLKYPSWQELREKEFTQLVYSTDKPGNSMPCLIRIHTDILQTGKSVLIATISINGKGSRNIFGFSADGWDAAKEWIEQQRAKLIQQIAETGCQK